jgi:hypothetical protein
MSSSPVSLVDTVSHLQHRTLRLVSLNQLFPSTSKGISHPTLKIPGPMHSPHGTRCPPFFSDTQNDAGTESPVSYDG